MYDRTAKEHFPLKRKWYRFNYDRATDAETDQVLRLVSKESGRYPSPTPSLKLGEWKATYESSWGATGTSKDILRFRHLFEYVPDEGRAFSGEDVRAGFLSVTFPTESYFEDESEERITLTQIFDCEAQRTTGQRAHAIVYDQPESILRIELADPLRPELWNADCAALMAQLFDVYRQLIQSRWLKSRCVVSPSTDGKCEAVLPVEEDCRAIILPFRQLHSQDGMDDLYNRCCRIHNRHCPQTHPAFGWVEHYKRRFNAFLNAVPGFPQMQCSITARQYLDAVAYGTGMIHASNSKEAPVVDLTRLLEADPRELVVMRYHCILRTLLGYVSMTIPVIQKNVFHWENDLGWAAPERTRAQELFG